MPKEILSKNISLVSEFNARKLSFVANRIQIFYLDKKGIIQNTCQAIWQINQKEDIDFFERFTLFRAHKEAIDFLFKNTNKEEKSLSINNLELLFEEETFFVDALFTIKKKTDKDATPYLECLLEDKTDYYTSLKNAEENKKLQEVEFLNEKWQLTKDTELLEINHQKELTALNEQLRVDWTNLLADNLKKTATQNFIQSNSESNSEKEYKNHFENLVSLSDSFEKISGICLFPKKIKTFLSAQKTISYLGKNSIHQKLIKNIVELAGGKFVEIEINQNSEFDFSKIDFIFIEQSFIKNNTKKDSFSACLLVEPTFLEKEQHLINNETNLLIYPLYPFQIWQQLLSFTNTNTMSYHEKIDLSQIYEIVDNEPMLVQSMLQILDKNLREYPAQLQQEFNDGELDTLRQTVHKFKSCTAYTGLTKFNTTLSEIESSQENGWTIAQIKDKLEFVLQAIPVIKVQVEAKLKELEKEMS
ncbi:Hpt domain-containing protein [Bernardetia sp. Wsw4-3y2]|uniref:Hpt domain-containing protein n=1 Tax=Bernardetia sp. Wsw4-3y2 TaxID=3127471 RepID=UPI0030D2CA5C